MRLKCIDESQQSRLSAISNIGEIRVTATLPWALKQTDNVFRENRPAKIKEFKYVISGVATEISETEILNAAACKEVNRISRKQENELIQTETCILVYDHEIQLPQVIAIGFVRYKLRMYESGPMRCKNCVGFDHTSKRCTHKPRCLHCGKVGHNYDACVTKNEAARCANCGGGHTAMDKQCPKFAQARERLRQTAAAKRLTYSHALVGGTNAVAAAAGGAPIANNSQTEQIKIDFETSLKQFAMQFTKDIQKVLMDYGTEIKKIKTAVTEIRDFQKEIETKMHTLESTVELNDVRVDNLVKENSELKNHIGQIHAHNSTEINELKKQLLAADQLTSVISPIIGLLVGATQLILDGHENNNEGSSLMNVKKFLKIAKQNLDQRNIKTIIKEHYWTDADQSGDRTPNS